MSTVEGDQIIRDESVDVESRVGTSPDGSLGLQESDVTPASWPTSSASNVTENNCELKARRVDTRESVIWIDNDTYLPEKDLMVRMCRLRDIERPPSSESSRFTNEASNASSSSSVAPPDDSLDVVAKLEELVNGSMFHSRMVASWEPDARISVSLSCSRGLNAKHFTQSSCPGRAAAKTNCR